MKVTDNNDGTVSLTGTYTEIRDLLSHAEFLFEQAAASHQKEGGRLYEACLKQRQQYLQLGIEATALLS